MNGIILKRTIFCHPDYEPYWQSRIKSTDITIIATKSMPLEACMPSEDITIEPTLQLSYEPGDFINNTISGICSYYFY